MYKVRNSATPAGYGSTIYYKSGYRSDRCGGGDYSFIFGYEVMEFLKNGHGKSIKSYEISIPDVRENPVTVTFVTMVQINF